MRGPYSHSFLPPAPILQVRFDLQETGLYTDDVLGLVDTGADTTVVPVHLLDLIEASVDGFGRVRGPWSGVRRVNFYVVDVIVENITLPGILAAGDDVGNEVILGRDVLNRLSLLLDGLHAKIEIVAY
jgi:predicted aspartyl protease